MQGLQMEITLVTAAAIAAPVTSAAAVAEDEVLAEEG